MQVNENARLNCAELHNLYSRISQQYCAGTVISTEREDFIKRLVQLRMNKGVSARDMSLSIGQSPNYINGIENGDSYPSMTTFFYICDYFGITPKEFFDIDATNPTKASELMEIAKSLPNDQLDNLILLAKGLKK